MARTTKFQDLNLNKAFLFAAAMEDEETCKLFIETILGEQLGRITVKSERMIMYNSDFRYVRLDVFTSEKTRDFNVEKIHSRVKALKKNRQLEEKYMTYEELMKIEYSKGKMACQQTYHACPLTRDF